MGCIYYHKNKINGHMYIGQSIYSSTYVKYGRWGVHGQGYRTNSYFWNAIKKYGWENFEHGFFEDNIDNELLNEKEKYYIALYHTYRQDPEYKSGYNLTPGGEGSMNTWWPEEDAWLVDNYSLDKTREQLVNEYYQAFPESYHSKEAIKARLKTLRLSNAKNINFWSEDENKKLIELWYDTPLEDIIKLFPGRTYDTLRAQAKKLGLKRKLNYNLYSQQEEEILRQYYEDFGPAYCKQLIKEQCGVDRSLFSVKDHAIKVLKLHCHIKFTKESGFDLEKFKEIYYNLGVAACISEFNMTESQVRLLASRNNFSRDRATIRTGPIATKVYCVELNKVFLSSREAAQFVGIKPNNILSCCRKERQTTGGYHWRYLDD